MLGHHRFASKFNGVSLVAPCRHANSVLYQKSISWTPVCQNIMSPQRVLRLNIPPKLHSYAYVVFVLVLPESFEHVELDLSLSSIGFEVVGYHLIISLTTNTSLNFNKKAWSTLNNLTGCLISMHLQYNSSQNREYRLILQFVIRGVEILCSNIHPRLKKFIKLPHSTSLSK